VPIQLAQCWFPGLAISNAKNKYTFQIKYSNSTLGIYQVAIYSKQAYICDFFSGVSTGGFTYEFLPGCNLAHWMQ